MALPSCRNGGGTVLHLFLSLLLFVSLGASLALEGSPSSPRFLSRRDTADGVTVDGVNGDRSASKCRCIPGDACWPKSADWASLNRTVGGRLMAPTPMGSVCHAPNYDAAACAALRQGWAASETYVFKPVDFIMPIAQNASCDPFTSPDTPCEQGNYPPYVIRVTSPSDIKAGLAFVKKHNIRLVIKNTGHDFLGKSSGKGALSLWTHNLNSKEFIARYQGSKSYSGPAIKIGAGVMFYDAYAFANSRGYRFVGGTCLTVGMAGGYTQGGGHSPLMTEHGMAAENVLEWEVVTPSGEHVVATPTNRHKDLFWALSGGGGGTYGVVVSMTTKLHRDGPIGGVQFNVPNAGFADNTTFWEGVVQKFLDLAPASVNTGTHMLVIISRDSLFLYDATGIGKTSQQVAAELKPFTDHLDTQSIPYMLATKDSATLYEHVDHFHGPFPYGNLWVTQVTGGTFLPKSSLQTTQSTKRLTDAFRLVTESGKFVVGMTLFNLAATPGGRASHRKGQTATNPAWTDSVASLLLISPWDYNVPRSEMLSRQRELTEFVVPTVRAAVPDVEVTGSYLNEANFQEPDWQRQFYGSHYGRLSGIKGQYDPNGLLYARTAVGSEKWAEDGAGRLCRV